MSALHQQYKAKPTKFVDTNVGRNIRAVQHENTRKNQRDSVINEKRNMSNSSEPEPTASKPEARMLRLQLWKAERDMRKKMELLKKKHPFLSGIVHHRLCSPISHNDNATGKSKQHQKVEKPVAPAAPPKRNKRATEKGLLSKVCAEGPTIFTESPNPSGSKEQKNGKKLQSIAPNNYKFNPPAGLHHMQLFDHVNLQSMSPLRLSEIVSTSRTRGASRKGYIPTNDTVMENLNISIEDELTAQYFQFLLNREINRLSELCEQWAAIEDEPTITEDAQYLIHQANDQTNLLIYEKFERFRGLVTDCETGKSNMLVTCKDLQRFWDMMYMEMKDCYTRFEKLEKLRTQGWKEEEPPISKPIGKNKATTRKKKVVPTKLSSLRFSLEEKRKKMLQETKDEDDTEKLNGINHGTLNSTFDKIENSPSAKYRTRSTSGSVDLDNKRFTPSNNGRLKSNLLLKVELSYRERISLTVIKVSKMCKTLDLQLDNLISHINSDQTPMKSVLKPSKTLTKDNSSKVPVDDEYKSKHIAQESIARRKSPLKVRSKDNENRKSELESAMDNMDLDENSDKRRCSRSVKFSEKDCSSCIKNKQVLLMTPHVRASSSRSQSTEKKRRSTISEDLISWETPEKLPAWVRRSQNKRASLSLI